VRPVPIAEGQAEEEEKTQAEDKDGRDSVEMLEAMQPPDILLSQASHTDALPCRLLLGRRNIAGDGLRFVLAQDASMGTTAHP
jgi:hypothetical protein